MCVSVCVGRHCRFIDSVRSIVEYKAVNRHDESQRDSCPFVSLHVCNCASMQVCLCETLWNIVSVFSQSTNLMCVLALFLDLEGNKQTN